MIIVKLQGGLGNQMFQYAFGKMMSSKLSTPLYFDDSFFEIIDDDSFTKRNYELNLFSLTAEKTDTKTLRSFLSPRPFQRLCNKLKLGTKSIYKESSLQFDKEVFKLTDNLYFEGYWQSEQYFRDVDPHIRSDFSFKQSFNALSKRISQSLAQEDNSVSVHVRRGDYVSSAQIRRIYGSCPVNYYQKAIHILNSKILQPKYYFFSDEPDWIEQNLVAGLTNFEIIKHNKNADGWQDMALMSQCKHHIIANSSFSWWGAWLNPSPNKIVIAPSMWFADPELNRQAETIVPKNWIRI